MDKQDEWDGKWVRMRTINIDNPDNLVHSAHEWDDIGQ